MEVWPRENFANLSSLQDFTKFRPSLEGRARRLPGAHELRRGAALGPLPQDLGLDAGQGLEWRSSKEIIRTSAPKKYITIHFFHNQQHSCDWQLHVSILYLKFRSSSRTSFFPSVKFKAERSPAGLRKMKTNVGMVPKIKGSNIITYTYTSPPRPPSP